MLKIPLQIRKFVAEQKMLFLPVLLHHKLVSGNVQFLIDTGSPFTVLSPREGIRFRYQLKELSRKPSAVVQLAGFKFKRFPLNDSVTFTFIDETGTPQSTNYSNLQLLSPTKVDERTLKECQHIPSIIGIDFLEDKGITLIYNPSRNSAFLEYP